MCVKLFATEMSRRHLANAEETLLDERAHGHGAVVQMLSGIGALCDVKINTHTHTHTNAHTHRHGWWLGDGGARVPILNTTCLSLYSLLPLDTSPLSPSLVECCGE